MAVLKQRELVAFDVNNAHHKKAYAYFLKHRKWQLDAPRFALEDGFVAIPNMIAEKLLAHYLEQEEAVS